MRLKIWRRRDADRSRACAVDAEVALLYESEAPRMRRWLASRFGPDKAGDFVQTAFLRLLRLDPDRRGAIDQPRAYLYRIAENAARDHARSGEHRFEQQWLGDEGEGAVDPHAALEARDLLRRIEATLPRLPDRTREIFIAHRFENLTYAQIAEQRGICVQTVEKHISIALVALRRSTRRRP